MTTPATRTRTAASLTEGERFSCGGVNATALSVDPELVCAVPDYDSTDTLLVHPDTAIFAEILPRSIAAW